MHQEGQKFLELAYLLTFHVEHPHSAWYTELRRGMFSGGPRPLIPRGWSPVVPHSCHEEFCPGQGGVLVDPVKFFLTPSLIDHHAKFSCYFSCCVNAGIGGPKKIWDAGAQHPLIWWMWLTPWKHRTGLYSFRC